MAIVVSVQPSEETVVRYVRQPEEPPSLVITDGSATVWLCPFDGPAGAELAVGFAERLITAAGHWLQACGGLTTPALQRPLAEGR